MGLKRWAWRNLTGFGMTVDTVKNIVEERSFIGGIKRTAKEDFCEDNPVTSRVYKAGKYDGKVDGYNEASEEYEEKLIEQANAFLKQKKVYESERDAYEELLDAYDKEIEILTEKNDKTEAENERLKQLLLKERKLKRLDR